MNILYLHTHDTGRYIQPYGHAVPTPNLQNLAQEGTLFRQAFCAGPTCSPSRAGLLTGTAPHTNGMLGLAHRGFQLKDYGQHLVQFLNRHGYETVLCGEQHEAKATEMIGYQKILDMDNPKIGEKLRQPAEEEMDIMERDLRNARMVADYLQSSKKENPFFLSFGMVSTHREFPELDGTVDPDYVMPPHPLYDSSENRTDFAAYIQMAKTADQCVGIVLEALNKAGLEEETLVIFTTDHGIAFPKMKCTLFDTGIGVSLIVKYPGNPSQGGVVDALVSQIDVFPTICDIIGVDKPDHLQGYSFLPILKREQAKIREQVYSEVTFHAAYEPQRAVRTERYKLIELYCEHDNYVPANIDDSVSKDFLMESELLKQRRDKVMLFDLHHDPTERNNLAEHPDYQGIKQELLAKLEQWMKETDDPLLAGYVQRPQGAIVNKLSCISPEEQDYE